LQLSLTKQQQMNWTSTFYFYDCLKKSSLICCNTVIILFVSLKIYSQSSSNQLIHQTVLQIKEDSTTIKALIDSSQRIILLDSARAMRLAEKSLAIAQKLNDKNNTVRGYCQIANVYSLYLQPDSALYYYKKSTDLSLKEGFLSKLPALYVNVANVYDNQGLFKKSVEYYNKALVICQQLKNRRKEAGILGAMGSLFLKNNQYKENIVYQTNAVNIYKEIDNKPGILYGLNSLASGYIALYKSTKNHTPYLDSALSSCENGFLLLENKIDLEGNHHLIPSLYYIKAEILFLRTEYAKAKELVTEAIQKLSLVNDKKILCNCHLLLGRIYSVTQNFPLADKEGLSALQLAEEVDDPSLLNDCYQQLSLQQLQKGDTSKAFYFQSKLITIRDSLFAKDKVTAINALRIEYETAQKEIQIEKLEKEKLLIGVGAGASLSILLLLLRSYRLRRKVLIQQQRLLMEENQKIALEKQVQEEITQNAILEKQVASEEKKKAELKQQLETEEKLRIQREYENALTINKLKEEQLQQEIEFKNRELTSQVVLLEKKNDFLLQIKGDIKQTKQTDLNIKGDALLKNINKLIDQHLSHEDDFENFRLHFEKVHTGFFDKLLEKSNNQLSQLDLRHCAYMRLNLSTKEIANLLTVEAKSIRMARYRLKQKFKLEKEIDFQSFIATI
jgi:hypothetical protein